MAAVHCIVSASRSAKSTTNVDSLEPMCVVAFASLFYIFIFLPFYKLLVRRRCPLTQFNSTSYLACHACKERFRFQRHVYRHQATCPAECQQSGKELVLAAKLICEHITVDKKAYVVMWFLPQTCVYCFHTGESEEGDVKVEPSEAASMVTDAASTEKTDTDSSQDIGRQFFHLSLQLRCVFST